MKKLNENEKPAEKASEGAAEPVDAKAGSERDPGTDEKKEKAPEKKPEPTDAAPPPAGEKPAAEQENAPDDDQAAENGEGAKAPEKTPEEPEKPEPRATEGELPAAPSEVKDVEKAGLQAELLAARSQLAAYAAGVAPDMIQDAVTLATAEAQAVGEVSEEAVAKAMQTVLKRHPEWKAADASKKKAGGFKLGADPDKAGAKKSGGDAAKNAKRWNRFK